MTLKYWLKSSLYGGLCFAITIYLLLERPQTALVQQLMVLALFSFLLFPFAKSAVERVVLRYTTREDWMTGMFIETPMKSGLYAMYYLALFAVSIPLGLIYLIFLALTKKAT